jgi:hypothetical protein
MIAAVLRRSASAVDTRLAILRKQKAAAPPELRPMATFDPTEPAILHDRLTDKIQTWTGEDSADYRETAVSRPEGTVEWRGFVFDGWGNVLGG